MRAEGRVSFLDLERTQPEKISPGLRETIKRVENRTLRSALDHAAALRPAFDELARNFDAIVTPSATRLDAIALPKTNSAAEVVALDLVLHDLEGSAGLSPGSIGIDVLIESALGLASVEEICTASSRIDC